MGDRLTSRLQALAQGLTHSRRAGDLTSVEWNALVFEARRAGRRAPSSCLVGGQHLSYSSSSGTVSATWTVSRMVVKSTDLESDGLLQAVRPRAGDPLSEPRLAHLCNTDNTPTSEGSRGLK